MFRQLTPMIDISSTNMTIFDEKVGVVAPLKVDNGHRHCQDLSIGFYLFQFSDSDEFHEFETWKILISQHIHSLYINLSFGLCTVLSPPKPAGLDPQNFHKHTPNYTWNHESPKILCF
jgi:hypothetical protein